jgi:DNA-binding NtrC family response regulator
MASILVVDDDADIREAIENLLARQGHEVTTAENGVAALHALGPTQFDLVITDIKMPEMGGFDLLQEVRGISRNTPVILMTGFPSHQGILDSISEGAFAYVEKPFDTDYLASLVTQALRGRAGRMSR